MARSYEETPEMTAVLGPQVRARGATKGRKKCTVCGRVPNSMTEHWSKESATHGPMSTENPEALRNLPGLDRLSKNLGALIFNDKRMR